MKVFTYTGLMCMLSKIEDQNAHIRMHDPNDEHVDQVSFEIAKDTNGSYLKVNYLSEPISDGENR